jgi:two-component system NtrC family sensor kinase
MMTTYKKYFNTQKTARTCCIVFNLLYIPGILIGTLLFFCPLQSDAQDSISGLPQVTLNPAIQQLKQSVDHEIADADRDHVTALLQTAKDQHYLPGQVVALCELASVYDGQQPEESAKSLQEAQQLAGQVRDFMEVSWAMGEVGKIQQYNSSKSADLRKGVTAVLRSLAQSMRNSKVNIHQRTPGKPGPDLPGADTDEAYLSGLKRAKMITQALKKGLAGRSRTVDWDFSDHWLDSLINKGNPSQKTARRLIAQKTNRDSIKALSNAFAKKGNFAEAYKYFLTYSSYKDSLTAEVSSRRLTELQYNQQLLKKESEIKLLTKDRQLKEQAASRQLFYMFALFGCVAALSTILLILNRNNRMKKRANEQLNAQKNDLQTTLTELKSTQTQLVHSEKMASLGELTAGIAHEIQNPLNFVNNFSEVSSELVRELIENQQRPEVDKELEIEMLNDVDLNLQKVSMHGKRASAIIKRMLEHSRTGKGEKEQTNLDTLIDEYLKLSYHGMRARDKSFEVKLVTDLKSGPQTINIVPQEIGRVLLNIINNAFYAVQQRQKADQNGFEPTVTITSYRENGHVIIKVKDNGQGMPEQVMQKVFQPFFTTKPTGEGTGLGLSLSYDIITKGHGGELSVASGENSYTEFTVILPA